MSAWKAVSLEMNMPDIKILTESDLRRVVSIDQDAVKCIEDAFGLLATQEVVMPPIMSFHDLSRPATPGTAHYRHGRGCRLQNRA